MSGKNIHPAERGIYIIRKAMGDLRLVMRELESLVPDREPRKGPMTWPLPSGKVVDIREEKKANERRRRKTMRKG